MPYCLFQGNLNPKDLKRHKIATQSFFKIFLWKSSYSCKFIRLLLQIGNTVKKAAVANQFLETLCGVYLKCAGYYSRMLLLHGD